MAKKSKNLVKAYEGFDRKNTYPLTEAIEIAKKGSYSKFKGSIDVAIKLNLDTTKAEQQLRGSILLPNSTGKVTRVLVISDDFTEAQAKESGADYFGNPKDLIEKITKGWFEFDVIITNAKMMPMLAKLGKTLGPKGLMPNPKTGTVTNDIVKAVKEFKLGRTEYRTDSYGNIHMLVGNVDSDTKAIEENVNAILTLIKTRKPSTVKGTYVQNISVSSTMGPGVKVIIANN